jgi:hypothetical protein
VQAYCFFLHMQAYCCCKCGCVLQSRGLNSQLSHVPDSAGPCHSMNHAAVGCSSWCACTETRQHCTPAGANS